MTCSLVMRLRMHNTNSHHSFVRMSEHKHSKWQETHETSSQEDFIALACNLVHGYRGRGEYLIRESNRKNGKLTINMERNVYEEERILTQRDGDSKIINADTNKPLGTLERFPNGEFKLCLERRADSLYSLENGKPPQFLRPMIRCLGCSMSSFKSSVNEAINGRASLFPRNWFSNPSVHCVPLVVDVLVCQNNQCGMSQDVMFEPTFGPTLYTAKTMHLVSVDLQRQRQDIIAHIPILPVTVAGMVVDYLGPLQDTFKEPTPEELEVSRRRRSGGFFPRPNKYPPGNRDTSFIVLERRCAIDKHGFIITTKNGSRIITRLDNQNLQVQRQASSVLTYRYIPEEERIAGDPNYKISIEFGVVK